MPPAKRRQFRAVCLLMLVGAFAELVALGSVVPFLSVLANPAAADALPPVLRNSFLLGDGSHGDVLIACTIGFIAAAILSAVVRVYLTRYSQNFIFNLGHDLSVEVQRRVLAQPYSFHASRNTSEVLSSLEKIHILVFNVLMQAMQASTSAVIALFIIVALMVIDPLVATLAACAFAGTYLIVSAFTRRRLAANSERTATAYARRVQIVQESLGGIRDIIIDHSERLYLDWFADIDRRLNRARASTAFIGLAPRFAIEAAGMVLIALLALFLTGDGGIAHAIPVLGALALGAQRLLPLIQQVYQGWTSVVGNRAVVVDVMELLNLQVPAEPGEPAGDLLGLHRELRVDRLSFAYEGRNIPALREVSLTIAAGTKVALIGKTGSGKSTLVDLVMGLLDPREGSILIDGAPLTAANRRAWQASIAHVPQSIFLAEASIGSNIALGRPFEPLDANRLVEAARQAQLHEFVETLPDGYDTQVGERGVRLSGGQRQRLGIARALYKNAPVLVLDEATSALDDETEAAVIGALDQLEYRPTVIMIAHRLTTIANCDLVVRLDGGHIVEAGTFSEVVPALAHLNN